MGYAHPVYDFLRALQMWNPTMVLIQKRSDLAAFPRNKLERDIQGALGKLHFKRAKGCPGCD
jgi:hypothetical protein